MKNKKWALICALILTVLTACRKQEPPKEVPTEPAAQSTEAPAESSTPAETSTSEAETPAQGSETKEESYETIVGTFEATTLGEANAKMEAGDEFFLYIGREDCPACRKFVPILKKIREEENLTVLYVDANVDDPGFPAMIEKYQLEFIPILMKSSGKTFTKLDYGGKVTEENVRGMFR